MLSLPIIILALVTQEPLAAEKRPYADAIEAAYELVQKGELDRARAELEATALTDRGFEWKHVHTALELEFENGAAPGFRMSGRMPVEIPVARIEAVSRLVGHRTACRAAAISPGGDRIASAGGEHEIRLWNARSGDTERVLVGHSGPVVGLAFSRDGRTLASASEDGSANLWDPLDGRVKLGFRATGEPLTALAWSADDSWLATADASLAVRLFSATTTEAKLVVRGHTLPITSLAFSSDGKYLASTSEDGTLRVITVATGDLARSFIGTTMACSALRFEPNGTRIVVTLRDGSARRLDLLSGMRAGETPVTGDGLCALAVSADGKRVATGTEQGLVQIRDADLKPLLSLRVGTTAIRSLDFDATTSRLVACGDDRTVFVLETDAALARAVQRSRAGELPSFEVAQTMKPLEVDALCRRVVERAGLSFEAYTEAEALARATFERISGSGQVLTTVGGALYRLERYDEALDTLAQATELKRGWPANLAFRAMTEARLEHLDEARTLLQRLEILMREKRWENDVDARVLLDEARSVVRSAKPAPK
ncbi:MAG: WD40 repeat domain-containing protein [Planctomycetes bacterium]|nr:WD40 repeat domain-containing protein [Planctomycetota bacterium]